MGIERLLSKGVTILRKSSDGLIAINKPSSMVSHPPDGLRKSENAVLRGFYDHRQQAYIGDDGVKYHLLHRLDKGTSGVLLLSEVEEKARMVRSLFKRRRVTKVYKALCFGRIISDLIRNAQILKDDMKIRRKAGQLVVSRASPGTKDSVQAITRVVSVDEGSIELLQDDGNLIPIPIVIAQLSPITGFSHQLRYQLFTRNLPVIGDSRYKTAESEQVSKILLGGKQSHLMLHSESIELECGFTATAPLPDGMAKLVKSMK